MNMPFQTFDEQGDASNCAPRLAALRAELANRGVHGFLIPRADEHQGEYVPKRAERLARMAHTLPWPSNVWIGVSIESPAYRWRIQYLQHVPAAVRFVSAEPLLAALPDLDLVGIHWLIAGGESQPGCRAAELAWFRDLRDQCARAGTTFFLKQLGGHPSKRGGHEALLDGRRHTAMPLTKDRTLTAELNA